MIAPLHILSQRSKMKQATLILTLFSSSQVHDSSEPEDGTVVMDTITMIMLSSTIVGLNMLFDGAFSYRLCWKCGMGVQADMRYIITCMAGSIITATVDPLPRYHFHGRYTLSQAHGLDSCIASGCCVVTVHCKVSW